MSRDDLLSGSFVDPNVGFFIDIGAAAAVSVYEKYLRAVGKRGGAIVPWSRFYGCGSYGGKSCGFSPGDRLLRGDLADIGEITTVDVQSGLPGGQWCDELRGGTSGGGRIECDSVEGGAFGGFPEARSSHGRAGSSVVCLGSGDPALGDESVDSGCSVGPNGGVSYGRKGNYRRNQDARDRKKASKKAAEKGVGRASSSKIGVKASLEEKNDLQKSSESKWQAQNKLAALKAEREIAILEATDLDEEKRKRRAQICAATERNLVSIEKFHSDLRKSGNTSSDDDTRVNTIFSASAGSISPSSSISEADVRKAKKDMEDAIAEKQSAIAEKEKAVEEKKKLSAALTRLGHSPEAIIGYGTTEVDIDAKTEWTVDSKDRITGDNEAILDIVYPDGYLVIHDDIDHVHPDGKRKVRLVGGERFSVAEPVIEEIDYDAKSHWSLGSRNAISDEMAAKLFEKFPNGYKENYDSYSDAVTGKPRGVIRPTALPPFVSRFDV